MLLLRKPTNSLGFGHENVPDPRNSYDFSVAHMKIGELVKQQDAPDLLIWGQTPSKQPDTYTGGQYWRSGTQLEPQRGSKGRISGFLGL